MFLLFENFNETCTDAALANILSICKRVLKLIQIIGPILAIVSLAFILIKYVINPEDKKQKNKIKNYIHNING